MPCPNTQCGNRALTIEARTEEVPIEFEEDGTTIASVSYGEWSLTDACRAYCGTCHWDGFSGDCNEEDACIK